MPKTTYVLFIAIFFLSCYTPVPENKNRGNETVSKLVSEGDTIEIDITEIIPEEKKQETHIEKIEILIEDGNLESHIRSMINKESGTLYNVDVLPLENISIYGTEILTLNGLEHFTNLKALELYNSKVENIDSVSELHKLELFTLYDANISDISPLASLPSIAHLDLMWNPIEDLTPLKNYTKLRYLAVDNFKDSDFQLLDASSESIEVLYLPQGNYSDISSLASLPKLRNILLSSEDLADFSVLYELPNMESVEITSNKLMDIDFVDNMSQLKRLNLQETTISDIKPLENLPIEELYLWETEIKDFNPISTLNHLRRLAITGPGLEKLDFLANNKSIEDLDIFRTSVTDISILLELPRLQSVSIGWLDINSDGIDRVIPELEKREIRINK